MDDQQLLAEIAKNTRFLEAVGRATPDARVIEGAGWMATIAPAAPDRSVLNSVVYDLSGPVVVAYDEIAAAYEAAGVRAWTVWTPSDDPIAAFLIDRGHVLDGAPQMMGMGLDELVTERPKGPAEWSRQLDPRVLGEINDVAYGYDPPGFAAAFDQFPVEEAHWYVARVDGDPVVCLMVLDEGTDVDVNMVAALPRARGRGLVGQLMTHALIDARERGKLSATLVATELGRPVYERIGFRALGAIEMWERRRV